MYIYSLNLIILSEIGSCAVIQILSPILVYVFIVQITSIKVE